MQNAGSKIDAVDLTIRGDIRPVAIAVVSSKLLDILHEDNHLLVIDKPAGLPTVGVEQGAASLITLAKDDIKQRYNKPGNVYLGVVSRLDRLVSGVVVVARTSKAAARLNEQFLSRSVKKTYLALIERDLQPAEASWEDWLWHNDAEHRVDVVSAGRLGAKKAVLHVRKIRRAGANTLLEVEPRTGRKHQIRVQLSARGYPILGDRKYGSQRRFGAGIALHSKAIEFDHPVGRTRLRFEAPLPPAWAAVGITP